MKEIKSIWKRGAVIIAVLLAVSLSFGVFSSSAERTNIYVDDDFTDDPENHRWNTIQEGINDAQNGDTVIVYEGTYYENVDVNKSVILRGKGMPMVDADGNGSVITLTADSCTIDYFKIMGSGHNSWDAGINVQSSTNRIINNVLNDNQFGVSLWYDSKDNILYNNTVEDNRDGIYLWDRSTNNFLSYNNVRNNDNYGINLRCSNNNILRNNTIDSNKYNFSIYSTDLANYINDIDTSNTVNNKQLYYLVNEQDITIDSTSNAGYVAAINSSHILVKDLTLTNNDAGVLFAYTDHSRIENINSSNNAIGIFLSVSCKNNILINNVTTNNYSGIHLRWVSDGNTLIGNTASDNKGSGIILEHSCKNILRNNITSNNEYTGISVWSTGWYASSDNLLVNNVSSNNETGIGLGTVINDTLRNNIMTNNKYNFYLGISRIGGYYLDYYSHNIDTTNIVDGKPMYYLLNKKNVVIDSTTNAGYVAVVNSSNIVVKDLTLINNYDGVLFAYTQNSIIENTSVSNNSNGIQLYYSSNNIIKRNNVKNNLCGTFLNDESSNNTIIYNTFMDNNLRGAYLLNESDSNFVYHNNFIDNGIYNASDNCNSNFWDNGKEGNYWSDFTGEDADGDGISDTPYEIPGGAGARDNYPLMEPYKDFDISFVYDFTQEGWLLVSLPVVPADNSMNTLFPTALAAFGWETDHYIPVTELDTCKGYWLSIPSPWSGTIQGIPLRTYGKHFEPGWHLIGSPIDSVDFTSPNDQPDGSVLIPAYRYDTGLGRYVATYTLIPGEGYWIAVMQECDLTIGKTSSSVAKPIAQADREAFYRQFGSQPPPPPIVNWQTGEITNIPVKFALLQNYPNPFNALTTIKYQLPKGGNVTLQVYDVLGRLVRTLVNTQQPAGYYELRWDGRDAQSQLVPSGLYFYRLEIDGFTSVKKMAVLK